MPDWVRPGDIHFDHAAADAALDAIAAARFTLEWAWAAEDRSANVALGRWEGLAAAAFRSSHGARLAVTEEASTRLSLLASAIEAAVDSARTEQARVDALQAEWDAQLRREREIAAEIAAEPEAVAGSGRDESGSVSAGVR